MSTLTWDHYCGSGGGAGREWSSCWSRPGPSRALPKNSDGVRMYERMHHTTLFYKLKVLWQNQAVGLVLLLHHILVGGGASWEEGGFRRCLSWVVFQKKYRASVTGMRVSFSPFLKQLIIYATCCLLPACHACRTECRTLFIWESFPYWQMKHLLFRQWIDGRTKRWSGSTSNALN